MRRLLTFVLSVVPRITCWSLLVAVNASGVMAQTDLIPGKLVVVKPAKLAKFISKGTFTLPTGADDPTVAGASVRFVDESGAAGDVTFDLPAAGWQGKGTPPGAKGFKYKGAGTPDDPCTVVIIKDNVVKAVCKGTAVSLVPPTQGIIGVTLSVGSTPRRYCAAFLGTEKKNTNIILKRKDAPPPPGCVEVLPTPTFTEANTPTETFTPGATPTRTSTPTPTPTGGSGAVCGNGLFEEGETCAGCSADCVVGPCTAPGVPVQPFRVDFVPPPFQTASSITVVMGYRDTKVSIPGNGNEATVGARIVMRQSGATVTPNDLNYALRVVYSRAGGINPGRIFVVNFDTCSSQTPATLADFTCIIEGCSSSSGPIDGCACNVTTP